MSGPLKILLIDDDENSFIITQELLREINGRDVELDWASEFQEGLDRLLADEHEIYLLDYRLDSGDGIDLLKQARAAGIQAPVIILTGLADHEIDQRALEAGATDYLAKDVYDVSRLEHAIRYALERQSLLKELDLERYLLRSLMDNLPDNIYFKDRDSRFIRISRAMAKWFKLDDPAEAQGRTDRDFFSDEHAMQALEDEQRLIERNEPLLDVEEKETWPDGSTTWVSTSKLPLRDKNGQVVGTFGVSRNISTQMEAMIALRRSERQNRMIVDTALDAFVAMDSDGIVIDWNPQAEVIFGWTRVEALGEKVSLLILPERFRDAHNAGLRKYLRTGEQNVLQRRLELTALHRSGREFPVEMTISPIVEEGRHLFSAFIHDITKRKRSEQQLQESKEAAEAASRAKSDFLANMSHEIRTPMNAIIGMTELVLDTELARSQREYLEMVRESGDVLLRLINDILDFSKIEAGKFELESTVFSLRDCLGDTLRSLAVRAHREDLELACHIETAVPDSLIGDPSRLRQIVVNLVGNAIKFTESGEVIVYVTFDQSLNGDVQLHFAVKDTGIGIPAEKVKAIFQAFEQADTSTTRKYGGTGLGLTICSRLVEMMAGKIWVESTLGEGSTFHFTGRFAVSNEPPVKIESRIVQGTRALVVDDNATNRLILNEMLSNWGMIVTVVEGVDQALVALRAARERDESFALVLSDVNMPDRDGFSLAEAVRQDEHLPDALIMMLTSGDRHEDVERCRELAVTSYLRKPIKQSELFDAIVAALQINGVDESGSGPATASESLPPTLPPLRVLLAEDSIVNQKLALALLRKWGHSATVAANGAEAVEHVLAEKFDLVLMDVQMPELDGLEATRRIRQLEQDGTIDGRLPIIAMTAHAMKGDRELCLEAGMDQYVSKPVRSQSLMEAMAEFFTRDSMTVELQRRLESGDADSDPKTVAGNSSISPLGSLGSTTDEPAAAIEPLPVRFAIDWSAALRIVQADQELLRDIAAAFLEESRTVMMDLKAALKKSDAKTAQRMAHTIKASFRTFGVSDAHDLAYECELAGRAGELDQLASRLPELEAAVRSVNDVLKKFVNTGQIPE